MSIKPLPEQGLTLENSVDVFHDWLGHCWDNELENIEFLFPVLRKPVKLTEFAFHTLPIAIPKESLAQQIQQQARWDYSLNIGGIETKEKNDANDSERRFHRFRVDLINTTLQSLYQEDFHKLSILDIACHCGVFSLDLAVRGAKHVQGIDIRKKNIQQANFLKSLYGIENCSFAIGDAEYLPDKTFDIILNLGLMYHITFPMQLLEYCYQHSNLCCVVDTNVYNTAFAGFYLVAGKDIGQSFEGKSHAEFLPTYRGLALAMKSAGFTDVFELLSSHQKDQNIETFSNFYRRVLIGFKQRPTDFYEKLDNYG